MPGTANGNGNGDTDAARIYMDAVQAQLGERVTNLGRRQSDLETEMRSGFRQMEASITSFTNETRNSIAAVSSAIADRNKPQWQAIGVAITFAVVLGGLAYWPIRENQSDLKLLTRDLGNNSVSVAAFQDFRNLYENNRIVSRNENIDKFTTVNNRIDSVSDSLVPRAEHERVWSNYDQRLADQQRQLDELKAAASSTYGTRDVLLDTRERLDRLERERSRLTP